MLTPMFKSLRPYHALPILVAIFVCGVLPLAAQQTNQSDTASAAPSTAASPAPSAIRWSVEDGWLTASAGVQTLLHPSTTSVRPIDLVINDRPLSQESPLTSQTTPLEKGGWQVTYNFAHGRLTDAYEPNPALGPDAWRRKVAYTNNSTTATQDLTGASLRVALATPAGAEAWHPQLFAMQALAAGRFACVAWQNISNDMYRLESRPGFIQSEVQAAWRLKPGETAEIGSQHIWLATPAPGQPLSEAFRAQAQRFYQSINLRLAGHTPEWLPGAIYYKTSAGGTIESRNSDGGGYDHYIHQLDYLADLGVTAVMYHSVLKHKTPPDPVKGGWNVYGILDYSEIDPISGGAEAFKRLADATRERGMRVFSELCLNGYYSRQAAALKPWWTGMRTGQPLMSFGGASMDYSCPEWQAEMARVAQRYAHEFGIEGMRLDLGSGSGDNWTSPKSNHASYSYLGGSLAMLHAVSAGATRNGVRPVLISEDLVHQPERYADTPLLYGFDLKQILSQQLPADLSRAIEINRVLRDFFETERGSLPEGGLTVRTLGGLNELVERGRMQLRFGAGLSRSLLGVMLAVPGVVQMTQEEEIGNYEAIRPMLWARRRIPELATGQPDYLGVEFAPEVFAVLRGGEKSHALGLCNLAGRAITGTVRLPASLALADSVKIYDAVSGHDAMVQANKFDWSLEPYAVSLIRIGAPPVGEIPPTRFQGEQLARAAEPTTAPLSFTMTQDGLNLQTGKMLAEFHPGDGNWKQVGSDQNPTGDRTLTVWECPSGRLELTMDTNDQSLQVSYQANASHPDGKSSDAVATSTVTTSTTQSAAAPTLRIYNADRWLVSGRTALLEDRLLRRHFPFPPGSNYHWDRTMVWGKEAQGMVYNNVFPTGRLWQSLYEPLHPKQPGLAFADAGGMSLVVDKILSNAGNIVLTDRTDETINTPEAYALDLRFYTPDPDLSPSVAMFGVDGIWAMPSYAALSAQTPRVSFRLSAGQDIARPALAAERLPIAKTVSEITRQGENFISSEIGVFYAKPGTITWKMPTKLSGQYRIQMLLRYSSLDPAGRDMVPGYHVSIDGKEQPLEWKAFNTFHINTAPFATVLTPPVTLDGQVHTLTIATDRDWLAVYPPFVLVEGTK